MAPPLAWRFFFDESVLGLGKSVAAARRDTLHTGHPAIPEVPLGALDDDWMPVVASRALVAVGRDRGVRHNPAKREAYTRHGLRYIWIGGRRDESTWEWLRRLARHWDQIEALIEELGAGPWIMTLNRSGPVVSYRPDH